MRILMLTSNRPEKGTFWRAFHLARVLAKRGHEVALVATSPATRYRQTESYREGVRILESPDCLWGPLRSGWDPWNVLSRIRWIRRQSFDLVHAFESRPTTIYPALYAQRRGSRLVMDWCDWFGKGGSVEERPRPWLRFFLRPVETHFEEHFRGRAHGTTVINRFLQRKAVTLGVTEDETLLLPNGCDARIPVRGKAEVRRILGLPPDRTYIGMIGGLYASDARLMWETFSRLHEADPSCSLLLIGDFHHPIDRGLTHPMASSVRFTGRIPYEEIFVWSAACDLFWCPLTDSGTNHGRFPLKLNDYLLSARPIVATEIGEIGMWIREHEVGVTSQAHADGMAHATLALLRTREKMEQMGIRARQTAETCLEWSEIGRQLESFYLRILSPDCTVSQAAVDPDKVYCDLREAGEKRF